MTFDTHTILTPSLQVLGYEIQRLVKEGYEIDPNQPPAVDAVCYECGMRKAVGDTANVFTYAGIDIVENTILEDDECVIVSGNREEMTKQLDTLVANQAKKAGRPRKNREA